jgi:hypothetical protein
MAEKKVARGSLTVEVAVRYLPRQSARTQRIHSCAAALRENPYS